MAFGPILRAMAHNRTRVILIVLEIAVTLAIVTNCVNMILDERRKMVQPSGFDDDNIVWVRSRPFRPEFRENQYLNNSIEADLRELRSIPGVRAVVNTSFRPWQGGGSSTMERAAGQKGPGLRTQIYYGRGDMFDTLGIKVLEGRAFIESDYNYDQQKDNPRNVIITKKFAELVFGTAHAVGKQLEEPDGSWQYNVAGIVDPFYNPYGWPIHEYAIFGPGYSGSYNRGTRYLVRVQPGMRKEVLAAIEGRLRKLNAGRAVETDTIEHTKEQYFAGGRLVVGGMTGVIALLVFVTALGIIGITSLSVAERTKQIGTRRALGATKADILKQFLLENWLLTTAGLLLGIVATYGLNFLLVTHVSGVKMDWRFVAIGMALLWLNGLAATVLPALRGMRVSPAIATRSV